MQTVICGDRSYDISYITEGQGEEIFALDNTNHRLINRSLIAACLNAADGGTRTAEDAKNLPMPDFYALLSPCLEINGMKRTGGAQVVAAEPEAATAQTPTA